MYFRHLHVLLNRYRSNWINIESNQIDIESNEDLKNRIELNFEVPGNTQP